MASPIFEKIMHNLHLITVYSNVSITPDIATELLTLNIDKNRPLTERTVLKYIDLMKSGEWRFNGDVIRISKTGKLIDGQHRLSAIAKSGLTIPANIATGLEEDVFDVIDLGKNRSAGDILSIAGIAHGTNVAGAVRIIVAYDRMKIAGTDRLFVATPSNMNAGRNGSNVVNKNEASRKRLLSHHQILEWITQHDAAESLQRYATMATRYYGLARFMAPSTYLAFLYIFSRKDRDDALFFFDLFCTGENISSAEYSMIYHARQYFINKMSKRTRNQNAQDDWAILVKAWNAFREKKEVKRITYNPDQEPFPQAI